MFSHFYFFIFIAIIMIIIIIISISIIIFMIIVIIIVILKRTGRRLAIPVQNLCVATSAAGKRVKLSLHYFFERHSDLTVQVSSMCFPNN